MKPLEDTHIYFFKNGVNQGEAFNHIYGGCYFPTLSLFKNVTVSVNFGPNFKATPTTDYDYRPVCIIIDLIQQKIIANLCWISYNASFSNYIVVLYLFHNYYIIYSYDTFFNWDNIINKYCEIKCKIVTDVRKSWRSNKWANHGRLDVFNWKWWQIKIRQPLSLTQSLWLFQY